MGQMAGGPSTAATNEGKEWAWARRQAEPVDQAQLRRFKDAAQAWAR